MTLASRNKFVIQKVLEPEIKKEDQDFFPTWNEKKDLLPLKSNFLQLINALFEEQYQLAIEQIEGMVEFKIQKTEYLSRATEQFGKYTTQISLPLRTAAGKGMEYQEIVNSKAGFSTELNSSAAKNRADLHAGALITGISETTRTRINKLITKALDEWTSKQELKNILKTDFGFSEYRANLIVRNELKIAYIQGQKLQFSQWQKESWLRGWKDWISHRDDRTTEGCLGNDYQGEVGFDELFLSGDSEPPRFPWCRCSIAYLPYFEAELWGKDEIKEYLDTFEKLDKKPENYDELSVKVVPSSFFDFLWEQITYKNLDSTPYFDPLRGVLNLDGLAGTARKYAEIHELGHSFHYLAIRGNRERVLKYDAIQDLIKNEIEENVELIKKYFPQGRQNALELFQLEEIFKRKNYFSLEKHKDLLWKTILTPKFTEVYKWDYQVVADLIGAIMKGELGWGHSIEYYLEKWYEEVMPAINTIHFFDNKILEVILPKSYTAIKSFYSDLGIEF